MEIIMNDGKKHVISKIASFCNGFCYADNLRLPVREIVAIKPIK